MDVLPLVLTSGWASGINAYAVVLVVGLLGRFGDVPGVPGALERPDVLIAAAIMFAIEFVTDKIPYVDSAWDAISTFIRPAVGATLGALIAGTSDTGLSQAFYAATGGFLALASHAVKSGLRLAINTSPEPISNITASLAEDLTVVGVISLAVHHPVPAAIISMTLLVLALWLVIHVGKRIRTYLQRFGYFGGKAAARSASPTNPP